PHEIRIPEIGELMERPDAQVAFYDIASGQLVRSIKPELRDITAMAFQPETDDLFVGDFSWSDHESGGIYRIRLVGESFEVNKIADVRRATAMTFQNESTLLVTCLGADNKESPSDEAHSGQLIRLKIPR
ncbi:MAG: hypothetical protein KDB27_28250, partial [Planctomycetales bacterium]|nr:hypothetical protein [Planctomycetales bacterium]